MLRLHTQLRALLATSKDGVSSSCGTECIVPVVWSNIDIAVKSEAIRCRTSLLTREALFQATGGSRGGINA